jgi:hypothetical protein
MFEVWSINYFEDLEKAPQIPADHLIQCHHHQYYLLDHPHQRDTPMTMNLHYVFPCLLISPFFCVDCCKVLLNSEANVFNPSSSKTL